MSDPTPGLFVFQDDPAMSQSPVTSQPSKPNDTTETHSKADEHFQPVSLYEYAAGLKNIQAEYVTYPECEIYVTKPLHVHGNVMEVELDADEEHPVFDQLNGTAIDTQTSVEYYVSYKQKPAQADWLPLLPKNQTTVTGEKLFFHSSQAQLRFPAQLDSIQLFENGLLMPRADYLLVNDQTVDIPGRHTSSIYTASYTPNSYKHDPHVIQLNDYKQHTQRITESFPVGTDINKTIHLTYTPFIDIQRVLQQADYNPNTSDYQPIQVTLTNASIQGRDRQTLKVVEPYRPDLEGRAYTYNKTLYLDKSWSDLKDYNLEAGAFYGGFDYYQWQNRLTFTEHFNVPRLPENARHTHGNATIDVSYDALVTDFRLKIILRRNSATATNTTPKVNHYSLRFKVTE